MFSDTKILPKLERASLDAKYLAIYDKARNKHKEFISRIEISLKDPEMKKPGRAFGFTSRVLEQHKIRLTILSKMISNADISADELELLMQWPGTKGKPEFTNYPHVQKPAALRRHST